MKNTLIIYNKDLFNKRIIKAWVNIIDELDKKYITLDYNDFLYDYEKYDKIIFLSRNIQKSDRKYRNNCFETFFVNFLSKSSNNKIIIWYEDFGYNFMGDYMHTNKNISIYEQIMKDNKDKIHGFLYFGGLSQKMHFIKLNKPYLKIPWYIKNYNFLNYNKKKDLIFWGAIGKSRYPLRTHLFNNFEEFNKKLLCTKLEHCGYIGRKTKFTDKNLFDILSKHWFSICTCEIYNSQEPDSYLYKKYIECCLSKTIPVGDIPTNDLIHLNLDIKIINIYGKNIDEIINILLEKLKNKKKLIEIIEYNYKVCQKVTLDKLNSNFDKYISFKKDKIFLLGFPKSGTTSFTTLLNNLNYSVGHYTYKTNKSTHNLNDNKYIGELMYKAYNENKNLLYYLQDLDAITQMDVLIPNLDLDYIPQIELFKQLYSQYPNANFILNTRPINDLIKSMEKWGNKVFGENLGKRIINSNLYNKSGLPKNKEGLYQFIENHYNNVRLFFKNKLRFLEYDIINDNITKLNDFLDVNELSFTHSNKNNEKSLKN